MDQKWIHVLVILVFCHKMTSAEKNIQDLQEGNRVEITCVPKDGSMVIWWRVLDTSAMEFIGSFSTSSGMVKSNPSSEFTATKFTQNTLILNAFKKSRDSGAYFCASLKNNALQFGDMTRLSGAVTVEKAKTTVSSEVARPPTPAPCICEDGKKQAGKASVSTTVCAPIILGPLAGSCGLLLLLLIIISVHCNKIRTRRCPHHYKKKPRAQPPGKQMMANRRV